MNKNFPKVSVIIPMFNTEKFIAICLESLLIQTLQDYEVILVDDGSTDSSPDIAESYLEKFGGRLKIISLKENKAMAAIPRNVGLNFARGKYVYFVDSDDFLLDTALEELFNAAENFQADVVYMEGHFRCNEELVPKKLTPYTMDKDILVEKPTLETNDISVRVKKFIHLKYSIPPWSKFSRRDFLIDNEIKFPEVKISEDTVWTFKIICLAKNFLRVPTPLYVHRENSNSLSSPKHKAEKEVIFWSNPLIEGVNWLNDFMDDIKLFNQPNFLRLGVLNFFVNLSFGFMNDAFNKLSVTEIYEIFLREFSKAGSTQPALIAYLLVMNNLYRNELEK